MRLVSLLAADTRLCVLILQSNISHKYLKVLRKSFAVDSFLYNYIKGSYSDSYSLCFISKFVWILVKGLATHKCDQICKNSPFGHIILTPNFDLKG